MNVRASLIPGFLLSLGLWSMYVSIGYDLGTLGNPGPGLYPTVLSALLVVLVLPLLRSSLLKDADTEAVTDIVFVDRSAVARFTAVTLSIAGFAVFLSSLGFLLTSLVFSAMLFWIGTPRRPVLVLLLTGLTVAFAYALFVIALRVPFPHGVWG